MWVGNLFISLAKDSPVVMSKLGAGLGLCGILAYQFVSTSQSRNSDATVWVTDGDTDALVYLRDNVHRNQIHDKSRLYCRQLLWGHETSTHFLETHCDGQTFDLILASDIVYSAAVVGPLWETVQTLLSLSGIFLFSYCSRRHVPINIEIVLEAADKTGFRYTQVHDADGVLTFVFVWNQAS